MKSKVLCIKDLVLENHEDSPYIAGEYYDCSYRDDYFAVQLPGWSSIVCSFSDGDTSILEEYNIEMFKRHFKTIEEIRDEKINDILNV